MLLAVSQRPISHICVPAKVADTMLPCRRVASTSAAPPPVGGGHLRRLLRIDDTNPEEDDFWKPMRMLSGAADPDSKPDFCGARVRIASMTSIIVACGYVRLVIVLSVLTRYSSCWVAGEGLLGEPGGGSSAPHLHLRVSGRSRSLQRGDHGTGKGQGATLAMSLLRACSISCSSSLVNIFPPFSLYLNHTHSFRPCR